MAKIVLPPVTNTDMLSAINQNFDDIVAEFQDKVFYRDNPVGETNTVQNTFDADGNNIINVNEVHTVDLFINSVPISEFVGGDAIAAAAQAEAARDAAIVAQNQAQAFATAAGVSAGTAQAAAVDAQNSADDAAQAVVDATPSILASAAIETAAQIANYDVTVFDPKWADLASISDATKGIAMVGSKLPRTGTVGRTLSVKLNEYVSVRDFGAVGDGATDDTAAFQAAYAACKQLFIPAGNYIITQKIGSLTDNSSPQWVGEGNATSKLSLGTNGGLQVSGIAWTVDSIGFYAGTGAGGAVVSCALECGDTTSNDGSSLTNCAFISNSPVSDGINQKYFAICARLKNFWYSTVSNNVFRNGFYNDRYAGFGIDFKYSVNIASYGNTFACFENAYYWGPEQFMGSGYTCEGHVISNNVFVRNTNQLYFSAGLLPQVLGNIIDLPNPAGNAIQCYADALMLKDNWISNINPILIKFHDRMQITGNIFDGTAGVSTIAINVEESDYGIFSNNTILNYAQGFTANTGCNSWVVTGNMIINTPTAAVNLSLMTNKVYANNQVNGQIEVL